MYNVWGLEPPPQKKKIFRSDQDLVFWLYTSRFDLDNIVSDQYPDAFLEPGNLIYTMAASARKKIHVQNRKNH